MGRLTLILLLLTIPVAAQAPIARVNGDLAKQLKQIADSQEKLSQEYIRLEGVKLTLKYRACLEAKFDAEKCDSFDVVADKEGFIFQPRPKETAAKP